MVGCRSSRDIANGTNVPKCMSRWWMQKAWLLLFINELLQHTWYFSNTPAPATGVQNAHFFFSWFSFRWLITLYAIPARLSSIDGSASCRILFVSLSRTSRFGYAMHVGPFVAIRPHLYQQNIHRRTYPARCEWNYNTTENGNKKKFYKVREKEKKKLALQWSARVTRTKANRTIEIDVKCFSFSFMNAACNFMSCTLINS